MQGGVLCFLCVVNITFAFCSYMYIDDKFERIGGTATGGGTFWGLGKLLTKAKGFDELLELASKGDHRKVNDK